MSLYAPLEHLLPLNQIGGNMTFPYKYELTAYAAHHPLSSFLMET